MACHGLMGKQQTKQDHKVHPVYTSHVTVTLCLPWPTVTCWPVHLPTVELFPVPVDPRRRMQLLFSFTPLLLELTLMYLLTLTFTMSTSTCGLE